MRDHATSMQEQSTTHHNRGSTLDSLPAQHTRPLEVTDLSTAQPHLMSTTLTHSTLFSVADQVTSVIDHSKHPYVTLNPPSPYRLIPA